MENELHVQCLFDILQDEIEKYFTVKAKELSNKDIGDIVFQALTNLIVNFYECLDCSVKVNIFLEDLVNHVGTILLMKKYQDNNH